MSVSDSVYLSVCVCLSVCLCLSECLSVCLPVRVSVCLYLYVCLSLPACPRVCLCLSLSVHVSVSLSVCLSPRLSLSLSLCLCLSVSHSRSPSLSHTIVLYSLSINRTIISLFLSSPSIPLSLSSQQMNKTRDFTSQQHATESLGLVSLDNGACCHTKTEVADQSFAPHPVTVYRHRANQVYH